jgi:hypothetical protein
MSYLDLLKAAKERLGLYEIYEINEINKFSPFLCIKTKEYPPTKETKEGEEGGRSAYAHPWPDELVDLGARHVGPYVACADCGAGTWVRFGERPMCLGCANAAQRRGPA